MGASGAAMEQEHFDRGVVAHAFGPDLKRAIGGFYGDHFDASCGLIIATCVIKIGGGKSCGFFGGLFLATEQHEN